jgi:hypothetical protein
MYICSVTVICGFNLGIQYEIVEEENYIILSLGMIEVVFNW